MWKVGECKIGRRKEGRGGSVWMEEGDCLWIFCCIPPSIFFLPLRWEGLFVDRRVWGATDYITVRNESGAYKDRSLSSLRILIGDLVGVGCAHFSSVSLSLHRKVESSKKSLTLWVTDS